MAYSPLGSNASYMRSKEHKNLLKEKCILELAEKYEKTSAQILLNWSLYRGHIVIPKTSNLKRLGENLNVYDFRMENEEY